LKDILTTRDLVEELFKVRSLGSSDAVGQMLDRRFLEGKGLKLDG
jgi:hypothetical protein